MKIVKNGKDLNKPTFNFDDVSFSIRKGSYYAGDFYDFTITINVSNDLYKEMKKIHKSDEPLIMQFLIYCKVKYNIDPVQLGSNPTKKVERASKGVKTIILNHVIESPYIAYALGYDFINEYSSNECQDFESRLDLVTKLVQETEEFRFDLRTELKKEASLKNLDEQELWTEKYLDKWKSKLTELEKQGIKYSAFI